MVNKFIAMTISHFLLIFPILKEIVFTPIFHGRRDRPNDIVLRVIFERNLLCQIPHYNVGDALLQKAAEEVVMIVLIPRLFSNFVKNEKGLERKHDIERRGSQRRPGGHW